ncbi:MAG: 4-phosphoerythronate dehydrogenase [Nitrospirota bacterium]|nr:4-phosphoerythronate dehydrogenase [Nitrospirota bacterium]
MKIVVDENVPFAKEAFSSLGEVTLVPGRAIGPKDLQDATVLVVRSITKIDAPLLKNSTIRFVGTATTGIDHIDQDFLSANDIGFASASGSNANSVAEYVLTALLVVAQQHGIQLEGKSLGIVGVGRIGSLVEKKAKALGMEVILNDPPLARVTGHPGYRPLADTFDADFITLHLPLSMVGLDKSYHLFNESMISKLSPSTTLLNTARGEVIDNRALLTAVATHKLNASVLDVWEGEPIINWDLVKEVILGTPHIAGYSFDGKVLGTFMIYQAACHYFGNDLSWDPQRELSLAEPAKVVIDAGGKNIQDVVRDIATRLHDLPEDSRRMKELLAIPPESRAWEFDRLRREYPQRREFPGMGLQLNNASEALKHTLTELGFRICTL